MSENPGLTPETLARFTPVGIDRDALLFAAGRAAARTPRGWKVAAGLLAVSQAATLALFFARTPTPAPLAESPAVALQPVPAAVVPHPPAVEAAPPPRAVTPWRGSPRPVEPDPDGYDAPAMPVARTGFQPHSYGAFLSATAPERLPPVVARPRTGPDLPPLSARSWERVRVEE